MRLVKLVFKALCYLCLAFMGSGILALMYVSHIGGCPRLDEGAIQCHSEFYRTIGTYGISVMYIGLFAGLPALFGLIGAILLLRSLWRGLTAWRRPAVPLG